MARKRIVKRPTTGYKVFYKRTGRWQGPYFKAPKGWRVREGSILRARVRDPDCPCGAGVNFWNTLEVAAEQVSALREDGTLEILSDYGKNRIVYEVQTVKGAAAVRHKNKSRASRVKLTRRISYGELEAVLKQYGLD